MPSATPARWRGAGPISTSRSTCRRCSSARRASPRRCARSPRRRASQPSQLELEITEGLFIEHGTLCGQTIQELRRDGFRIVLDDFGTGYSSLSCLRRFPVDKIKLDRSFIDIAARDQSVAIIRAAVTLGHAMDLEVVAEGISCREEEQIALEAGCDAPAGPSLRAGHAGRARSPPILASLETPAAISDAA